MLQKVRRHIVFIGFVLVTSLSFAQDLNNLSPSDLNSINVDALTDEQIQKFYEKAQESGLTLDQLELVAKQRGMSSSQIAKLRTRITQIQSGIKPAESLGGTTSNRLRELEEGEEDNYQLFNFLKPSDSTKSDELKIFGLEIFRSSDLSFEPSLNVATPENYVIGAGDEIIIDVYGASEITYQQVVSPDGIILIEGIGPVSLGGLTIKETKRRIFNKLSNIYSGLRGSNPNTFIQVSLGQARSIKVNVVGHAVQPGTYTLSSFSSAFNALSFSGGPSETGSMRQIEIVRNNKKIANLDVYDYLFNGDDSENPLLQDQDIVIVKPYLNRIKLAGNVKNPAIYELKEDETVADILKISGGFTSNAYKKYLTVDRFGEELKEVVTVGDEDFPGTKLIDGDSIFVSEISNRYTNRIKVEGAVIKEGYLELADDLTLSKAIELAGGLREDAYLKRANIIRLTGDLRLTNITFDVKSVLEGSQDFVLNPNDVIRISSIFQLEEDQIISLLGEVNRPGEYPFIDSLTVEDLINIAGGLTEKASTTIEVARRISDNSDIITSSEIYTFDISADLGVGNEASNFLLRPFDLVIIKASSLKQNQKIIRIEGEVKFPGYYALETNEDKISDLIARAGGLTEYGYAEGASLIRRTEYFRSEYEKEELQALLDQKRIELEKRYNDLSSTDGLSVVEFIDAELVNYEKELTENIKKSEKSSELEARIFRAQQLRKLQQRDSIGGSLGDLIEQQSVGIRLDQVLKNPNSNYDLILNDGDLLSIPRQLETVKVQGEVLFPNTVKYSGGMNLKKYVSQSGGFSSKAKQGKSYVVYANGSAQRTKKFLWFNIYPPVKPGADIIVPKREPRRKVTAAEVIGISSSLATMALIINQLTN